jgi:hypothetical protein
MLFGTHNIDKSEFEHNIYDLKPIEKGEESSSRTVATKTSW